MKTLADLKRELKTGRCLILVSRHGQEVRGGREVADIQSNGVYLMTDDHIKSWLEFPKASLLDFEGAGFRIHKAGKRPLTMREHEIRNGRPKNEKQAEIDLLSDGSSMYWQEVRHYKENKALYLMGHTAERGMKYDYKTGKVWDDKIKGEVVLEYVFVD